MNIIPPNDVGIWAAFSVSNCGNSVPKPSAMPHSAIVIIEIVMTDTANMKSLTWSIQSVTNTIPNASTSNGVVPTQNFAQRSCRTGIGLDRNSQSVRPSSETLGKM